MENAGSKLYWKGVGSTALEETGTNDQNPTMYIFFNGARIARIDPGASSAKYYVTDNVGSTAVEADASGDVLNESLFFPYGVERIVQQSDTANNYRFSGKERDPNTGLDDFGARYYESTVGRFMTPDWDAKPTAVPYAAFGDPQTLNLYSYVENGPLNRVDADGHAGQGTKEGQATGSPERCSVALSLSCNPLEQLQTTEENDYNEHEYLRQIGANTGAQQAQQQSTAVPLQDSQGKVVQGASGNAALVPSNFNVHKVIDAGTTDLSLRIASPALGDAATVDDLANFRRGGKWDLQRLSGTFDKRYIDSATILIGMYAAASGISQDKILSIENAEATHHYAEGTPMDSTYTHLPVRNVTNTRIGMQLVLSGAIQ